VEVADPETGAELGEDRDGISESHPPKTKISQSHKIHVLPRGQHTVGE